MGARRPLRRARPAPELLLQPVPVRLERSRPGAGALAQPGRSGVPSRRLPALASVGLDRRAANRPLHRNLEDDAGADPRVLRSRLGDRVPARGGRALLARPRRKPLCARLRADGAQADRDRDPGVQQAAPAADNRRRRPGVPPAAPDRGPDRVLHRALVRQLRRGGDANRARAGRDLDRGVRDRSRRESGGRPAGDSPQRRGRARDRDRRGHRPLLVGRSRRACPHGVRVRYDRDRPAGVRRQRVAVRHRDVRAGNAGSSGDGAGRRVARGSPGPAAARHAQVIATHFTWRPARSTYARIRAYVR